MYTSVMLVAMLSPGAPPVITTSPARQIVHHATSRPVNSVIPSSTSRGIVSSGTVVYSQPVYVVNGSYVTSTYPGQVIRQGSPVVQSGAPVTYVPASGSVVCRT